MEECMEERPEALQKAYREYDCKLQDVLEHVEGKIKTKVTELLDRRGDIILEESCFAYAEGVRFGVRLMTEALQHQDDTPLGKERPR